MLIGFINGWFYPSGSSVSLRFLFLFGEFQYFIDLLPIPQPLPLLLAVVGALLSTVISLSFIYFVLYGKINPFFNENVNYDQTLQAFVIYHLFGSLAVFFISLGLLFLFSSWFWFFQIFFALGIASIFYMFMDSAVIELLKGNTRYPPDDPSVQEVDRRGSLRTLIKIFPDLEKKFLYPSQPINQVNSRSKVSDISNGFRQKLTQLFDKLRNKKTDNTQNQTKERKPLEPKKPDFTPVTDFTHYQAEGWKEKKIFEPIKEKTPKQPQQKEQALDVKTDSSPTPSTPGEQSEIFDFSGFSFDVKDSRNFEETFSDLFTQSKPEENHDEKTIEKEIMTDEKQSESKRGLFDLLDDDDKHY